MLEIMAMIESLIKKQCFYQIFFKVYLFSVLINLCFQLFVCFSFTGINIWGMLHHVCDVAYDGNRCGSIRTHDVVAQIDQLANCFYSSHNFFPHAPPSYYSLKSDKVFLTNIWLLQHSIYLSSKVWRREWKR